MYVYVYIYIIYIYKYYIYNIDNIYIYNVYIYIYICIHIGHAYMYTWSHMCHVHKKYIFTSIALIQPRKKQLSSGTVPHPVQSSSIWVSDVGLGHLYIHGKTSKIYPLVNIQKAIEHGHRTSGFSLKKWWFSIAMLVHQRVFRPSQTVQSSFIPIFERPDALSRGGAQIPTIHMLHNRTWRIHQGWYGAKNKTSN